MYKSFDELTVLSNVSIEIMEGEKIALLGPSGTGKTTLLNFISNSVILDSGKIKVFHNSITVFNNRKNFAKYVGIVRQQFDLVLELKVIHNVLAGRLNKLGFFKSLLELNIYLIYFSKLHNTFR